VNDVRILKLSAAQRQLDAAVRMTFADEDVLAITTVAAAAYRILRDVAEKRGHNPMTDDWRDNVLGVARALVKNELPEDAVNSFKADSQMWPIVSILAEKIRKLGADRTIEELRSIVTVDASAQTERSYWRDVNRAANFLKHADVDFDQALEARQVNANELIFGGCRLYMDLLGHLTAEMEVWTAYYFAESDTQVPPTFPWADIAAAFRRIDSKNRKAAGSKLIEIQKKFGAGTVDPPK
jgi:hypothetical protein